MSSVLVYVTAPNREVALALGRAAVGDRLAACANVLDGMTAVFRWDGAVQEEAETVLILKTREALVDTLTARLKADHPYDCPCVVALPITGGNGAFLDWIGEETR
ncbi:MAG: divalent-cation tolerance protein CutA [Rhodobacterales bacterium]|nr:divalent-cation tolerance protein CutA [Rhodobacterales bacterium]